MQILDALVLAQRVATALLSAFNAAYFALYRTRVRRLRLRAMVLALVNLALLVRAARYQPRMARGHGPQD